MPAALRGPLSHMWARLCHGLHGHLDWVSLQCSPLTCGLERLYDWAALYGVGRLGPRPAVGTASVTGSPGAVVLAGTALRGPNGLDYVTGAANFMANSGAADVAVRSAATGAGGNLPAGAVLTLADPLPGVDSRFVVGEDGLTGGAAEEAEDDWRLRVAAEWQAVTARGARGGNADDYRAWARAAHQDVTGALVFPGRLGAGSVAVYPVCNNAVNRLPSAGVLQAVSEYLGNIAPATADWRVAAPTVRPVSVALHLDPAADSAERRERIAAAVLAAVLAEGSETAVLNMAEIDSAVATVTNQYTRMAPMGDVAVAPGEVLVLSEVLWQ